MSRHWVGIVISGILIVLLAINIVLLGYLALHGKLPDTLAVLARKVHNFWRFNVSSYGVWRVAPEWKVPENLATTELPVFDLYADPLDIKTSDNRLPERKGISVYDSKAYNFKYIPAKLEIAGHKYNIELCYRGISWWHWYGPKKSLRLKFPDNDCYLGIRLLNLNNPKYALPFLQSLSYQLGTSIGILSPRSFLVHVRLNNKYYGIMEAFEHTDRHFLQHKNKLPGDIYGEKEIASEVWRKAGPDLWKRYSIAPNSSKDDFSSLERLISVINKEGPEMFAEEITNVLEVDSFLKLYVLEQIISSHHTYLTNIRIYCNPKTKKFEFILWDPMPLRLSGSYALETPFFDETSIDIVGNILARKILAVPLFRNRKNEILWDLVKDDNFYLTICSLVDLYDRTSREDLLCDGNRGWQDDRNFRFPEKVYEETLNNFKKSVFARISKIRKDLQDMEVTFYFHEDKVFTLKEENLSKIFLSLRLKGKAGCRLNYLRIPSNVIATGSAGPDLKASITMGDGRNEINKEVKVNVDHENNMLELPLDYILSPTLKEKLIDTRLGICEIETCAKTYYLEIELKNAVFDFYNICQWLKRDNQALSFYNTVTGQAISTGVKNFNTSDFVVGDLRNTVTSHKISKKLVLSDSPLKEIFWEGDINLAEDTVIEKDEVLYIRPGTKVKIAPLVCLIIKGKIVAQGKPDALISFDSLEDAKNWGSIAVDDSAFSNIFSHCLIRGGHMDKERMYNGALYVYNSDVTVDSCDFYDNIGEDALNCQGSQVKILNCKFYRSASDGIDLDSCQGEISASLFKDNKGDAIDISDSQVLIKDNTIFSSGDKGISVGENSFPEIINNFISDNVIGVAVKDRSGAVIYKCTIINNQTGLALYQKKDFFGGAKALVCSSVVKNNTQDLKCDKKSEVKFINSGLSLAPDLK